MTTLDDTRAAIRRRAIADGWPTTLLSIAEDFADTAREDGTHALRTREEQARRLGISEATVKRHRQELQRLGVLRERRRGGRGRGASVMDLTADHGSRVGVTVTPDPVTPDPTISGSPSPVTVTPDPTDNGSIAGQSRVTVERERDPRLLSSSPTSSKPEPAREGADDMDRFITELAAELDADPIACRSAVEAKIAKARPDRPLSYVKAIPAEDWRALVEATRLPPPPSGDLFGNFAPRKTLNLCDKALAGEDCSAPHPWEDARNFYHCQGA